ncbi:hypothetical protein K2Y11_22435 [bacterium]|nr:hypothetical protein [bacterium]
MESKYGSWASDRSDTWLRVGHYDPEFKQYILEELEDLKDLRFNWDQQGGKAIDLATIEAAKRWVASIPEGMIYRPHVVPMSTGAFQFEWQDNGKALELEFESPDSIRYLMWHPAKEIELEDSIPLTDVSEATSLIQWFLQG